MQVYHQVHALLPDVHYSALAKVLSLKTPGKRKQERLPGDIILHWVEVWYLGVAPAHCLLLSHLRCCAVLQHLLASRSSRDSVTAGSHSFD